jgi:hypothetical protein
VAQDCLEWQCTFEFHYSASEVTLERVLSTDPANLVINLFLCVVYIKCYDKKYWEEYSTCAVN